MLVAPNSPRDHAHIITAPLDSMYQTSGSVMGRKMRMMLLRNQANPTRAKDWILVRKTGGYSHGCPILILYTHTGTNNTSKSLGNRWYNEEDKAKKTLG
jgi:hypothetical protein